MKVKILYEDNDVVVVDKPAGISVHNDGKNKDETLADWFIKTYPGSADVGEPLMVDAKGGERKAIMRPGIVHRLDRETSGVIILAKNQEAFLSVKNQFMNHTIEKIYQAFVYGYVADPKASLLNGKMGLINAPIGRSPGDVRMWTAGRGARDPIREASTYYLVLSRFTDTADEKEMKDNSHQFSYLELYPKTGRTHQLRVHLRYINHQIVSDPIYRGKKDKALGFDRLALHARSIKFRLPKGREISVEAPLPADFTKVIENYSL
ncbi:MAG: RluA family pseudouridine synthase [Candidatus Nomurabacteria bacterium]|nr:RluA family pseudouridine synthase [Candidatus Nomurabacteria bacterium]